jgi:hypothetical protein
MAADIAILKDIHPSVQVPDQGEAIMRLQRRMADLPEDQRMALPERIWEFFPGGCACGMIIPKDMVMVGKIHKAPHLVIALGDISVQDETGTITRMQGFRMFTSPAGVKRAGWAHEDTIFINVHVGDVHTPEEAEAAFIQDEPSPFEPLPEELLP